MNVCLIQPPSSLLLEDKVMPPLGILYLAAWLRKNGHQCSIIDLAGVDDWVAAMKREKRKLEEAAFVGITSTTPQYGISRQLCAYIKAVHRKPVVIGGIHTTSLVHANELSFLKTDGFDSYVIGEGYHAVTRICEDLGLGERGSNQATTSYTPPNLKSIYSEPILADVNLLPFAARDLIDIRSYKYKLGDVAATTFYSQYGCPYACQYCESPMAGSFTVRAMSPQRIQDEIREIRDKYGIHGIMFFDDEMNLNRDRMLGICEKIKALGDIIWRGFVVTAKFDGELAQDCKSSGCFEIASGIESGSATILKNIRKPATIDINRRFIRTAKKAGLRVKAFCIVGLPNESWRTVSETNGFFQDLANEGYIVDDCDFSILQVYKGSPLYQKPQDLIIDDVNPSSQYYKSSPDSYENLVQIQTPYMTKYDLICARNWLEYKWKKKGWLEDATGRKDLDRIYQNDRVWETIKYAEKKLLGVKPIVGIT